MVKKRIIYLLILLFVVLFIVGDVKAQDEQVRRIKDEIFRHREAIKRLEADLQQVKGGLGESGGYETEGYMGSSSGEGEVPTQVDMQSLPPKPEGHRPPVRQDMHMPFDKRHPEQMEHHRQERIPHPDKETDKVIPKPHPDMNKDIEQKRGQGPERGPAPIHQKGMERKPDNKAVGAGAGKGPGHVPRQAPKGKR